MRYRSVALVAGHMRPALRPAPRPTARHRRDCRDGRNRARRAFPECAAPPAPGCRHSRCRRGSRPRSRSGRCVPSGRVTSIAVNATFAIAEKRGDRRLRHQRHAGLLDGLAQAIDQFAPGPAAAGHASGARHGRDSRNRPPRKMAAHSDRPAIRPSGPDCAATRSTMAASASPCALLLDIAGKQLRRVDDAARLLKPRCRRGDQPGRQRGRAARQGIALEDDDLRAGLMGSKRGAKTCRPAADNEDGNGGFKTA